MIWNIATVDEEVVKMHERTFKTLELWCKWYSVQYAVVLRVWIKTVHLIIVSNLKIKLTKLTTVDLAWFTYKISD